MVASQPATAQSCWFVALGSSVLVQPYEMWTRIHKWIAQSYKSGNIWVKWQVVKHLCTSGDGFFMLFACGFKGPVNCASFWVQSLWLQLELSQESLTQHPTPLAWTKGQHRSQWCCIWDRKWWNTPIFQHIVWRGSRSVCSAETPWLSAHGPRICSQNEWMDEILPPFTVKCFQNAQVAQVQFEGSSCFLLFLPRAQDFLQILPAPPLPPACSSPIGTRKFQELHCFQYLTAIRLCAWGLLCSKLFWSHYFKAAPHNRMTSKQVTLPETAGWKY